MLVMPSCCLAAASDACQCHPVDLAQPDRAAARGQPSQRPHPILPSSARGRPCGSPPGGRRDGTPPSQRSARPARVLLSCAWAAARRRRLARHPVDMASRGSPREVDGMPGSCRPGVAHATHPHLSAPATRRALPASNDRVDASTGCPDFCTVRATTPEGYRWTPLRQR